MASLLSFALPKPTTFVRASSSSSSSSAPATAATTSTSTHEALNDKFARKGIHFSDHNGVPVVDLTVRNGSSVRVRVPDAHVTSYRPKVSWDEDGFEEVLYTIPASSGPDPPKFKGGVGLVINDVTGGEGSKGSLVSSSEWTVKDVDSDAIDALQVHPLEPLLVLSSMFPHLVLHFFGVKFATFLGRTD